MTINVFKESSATARALGEELRSILEDIDPAVGQPLLERLELDAHSTPRLVFTGYHSAGKSTLIEALTDRAFNIPIGSGVTTDSVTEYDWDGDVLLVDTPGVHADRPDHDELAERAIQSADLVLFAVPVELFDDTLVAHLQDVLGRLAKSRQTLIVITKAGTMEAAPGHREAAIKKALGSFEQVPWVECDAQYYLDGLDLIETAPEESSAFIEASGLTKVAELINGFAMQQGELGRLSQPLQLLGAISLEASASLTDDPNEQATLKVLARHRSALTNKRIHLGDLLEAKSAQFRSDSIQAVTKFADGIERDEQGREIPESILDGHRNSLNESLNTAHKRFEESVMQLLEVQFDDLASEILAIEATPFGRLAIQLGEEETVKFDGRKVAVPPGKPPVAAIPSWAGNLSKHLEQFSKSWGASDGVRAAAGSNGHKVVLKVGHAFGKKFTPWEAVKTANAIGKIAKFGGVAIPIGLELYGVIAEDRAAEKAEQARAARRRNITQEILAQTDAIVAGAIQTISGYLDEIFTPELQRIDAMAAEVHGAQATRSELRDRLASIHKRAISAVTSLASQKREIQ